VYICDVASCTIGKGFQEEGNGKHESRKVKERRGTRKIKIKQGRGET
jgi:hypothetical protein